MSLRSGQLRRKWIAAMGFMSLVWMMQQPQCPLGLTAGKAYGFAMVVKEGGGGDWFQVAWRKEGDDTPGR